MQGEFSFASQPHAAPVKRKTKYRDENEQQDESLQNIMHDPRVIRGNTYAAKVSVVPQKESLNRSGRTSNPGVPSRRKFSSRRVASPPPVDGRVHMEMQTEDFLEELTDRPIEMDAETQTLPFMDRPPSPLYVKAKTGRDVETQIHSGDLFDFDIEVEPILEILVGKTIHVSMLELMQEEELEAIRLQQAEFEAIRNVELAEVQRLEAEARRKAQEKERRLQQEKQRAIDKRKLEEKIAARAFAYQYLGSLHDSVFDTLENEGFFYDPLEKEVEEVFMSDLLKKFIQNSSAHDAAATIAQELLEAARKKAREFETHAIALRQEMHARLAREEAAREAARLLAEEEACKKAEAALAAENEAPEEA